MENKGFNMRMYLAPLLLSFCLFGCDVAKELKEMTEKQAKVQTVIKEKYGWDSQVGWQIHNGVLTQVTVVLNAEEVKNEKVSALEAAAQEAVSMSFSAKPKAIYIQIASKPVQGA